MQRSLPLFSAPTSPRQAAPSAFRSSGVDELFAELGGAVFGEGAYRIHDPDLVAGWTDLAVEAFPSLKDTILCFASDWLGRQFAVSTRNVPSGRSGVVLVDIHWDEVVFLAVDVEQLHGRLLADDPRQVLALSRYADWRAAGGAIPRATQCVDFTVPVYLGGADDVSNMSINDFEVVWGIGGQLLRQVRDLPPGTHVDIDII